MICKECGCDIPNWYKMRFHLKNKHFMTSQDYYDKYLKCSDEDKCIVCGNKNVFKNPSIGYSKCCSQKCYINFIRTTEWVNMQKNTKLKHFGDANFNNSNKSKITRLNKNNGKYFSNDTLEKIKQTCIERYGDTCPSKNKNVKEKIKNTCLEKYGVESAITAKSVKQKIKNTMVTRYGVEHFSSSEQYKLKYRETCNKRYNCDNPSQNAAIKEKIKNTFLEKYGVDHPMKVHEIFCKTKKKHKYDGKMFDSKPEIEFYKKLKENFIDFEYQPNISFTYEYNGVMHNYYPDFRIGRSYYEIKGRHFFDETGKMINPWCRENDELSEAKHQCMINNNIRIIIV